MKYVVILVVVILFTRIDYLLGLFDKASDKINNAPADIEVEGTLSNRETIPLSQDRSLHKTKKDTFYALLESFSSAPTADVRLSAIAILKENPAMFNQKLDKTLENHVFAWRDLLNNNEPELVNFLLDFMGILQGENLEMVKKFFSLWMEINMEHFIAAYSRTRDTNCTIATWFGDTIPEEEKVNEYVERVDALNVVLAKEKLDPAHKALATNCVLQLNLMIDKIAPKPLPETVPAPAEDSSQTISPVPAAPAPTTP